MLTKPIEGGFIQICATSDHIYGLDREGNVYYRDKAPTTYSTNSYNYNANQTKTGDEEKKAWKKLFMEVRIDLPKGGPERVAQVANDGEVAPTDTAPTEIDEPAKKIYKDVETVKRVQTALKEKGFYKKKVEPDTYKIDGDLGNLTTSAIKEYQKSVNLKDTGEIDLNLCNSLGLNEPTENETVVDDLPEIEVIVGSPIELSPSDIEEDDDEIGYCGA